MKYFKSLEIAPLSILWGWEGGHQDNGIKVYSQNADRSGHVSASLTVIDKSYHSITCLKHSWSGSFCRSGYFGVQQSLPWEALAVIGVFSNPRCSRQESGKVPRRWFHLQVWFPCDDTEKGQTWVELFIKLEEKGQPSIRCWTYLW